MSLPLHDDAPDRVAAFPDGKLVRNLSAEEYAATYATGEPHHIPADVLAAAETEAARLIAERTSR